MADEKDEDLMTRREVARKFQVTSATVRNWAHRKAPLLTEISTDGGPRYKRSEVEALLSRPSHGGSPDHE